MEFLRDMWGFLRVRKKFWLLPIMITLLCWELLLCLLVDLRLHHLFTRYFKGVTDVRCHFRIVAYYHDSAAALLVNGEIIAAAQEERFTREKHTSVFPANAAKYVLEEGGIDISDLDAVAFYDKPYLKFERLLETYHGFAPQGLKSFLSAIPVWIKEKLFMRKMLKEELEKSGQQKFNFYFRAPSISCGQRFFPVALSRSGDTNP